jgi:hypothetical protein
VETWLAPFGGGFKIIWAYTANVAMASAGIIERLNVVENILVRLVSRVVDPFLNSFFLQAGEEGLSHRIVPTVSAAVR